MDGYIAIVDRETFKYSTIKLSDDPKEAKPYWATSSKDGTKAYVSISGLDKVSYWITHWKSSCRSSSREPSSKGSNWTTSAKINLQPN